jgi:hypothetical protein
MSDVRSTDERLNVAIAAQANVLLQHVVPLFSVPPGKRPVLIGTSVLVESSGSHFLVSARHVIEQAKPPGRLHYYFEPGGLHLLLGSVMQTGPLPSESKDAFDLAVIRLPDDARKPSTAVWKRPLDISALVGRKLPRGEKQYLVTGFPKSRSRANPHSRKLLSEPSGFKVVSASSTRYADLGVSEASHLVLSLDIRNMRFPDGTTRPIADPHGMSGSPVWLLYDESGENDLHMTQLVGIAIEYYKDEKLLVATDASVALDLIRAVDA